MVLWAVASQGHSSTERFDNAYLCDAEPISWDGDVNERHRSACLRW